MNGTNEENSLAPAEDQVNLAGVQAQPEPTSLSEAYEMYRRQDASMADSNVVDGESVEVPAGGSVGSEADGEYAGAGSSMPVESGDDGELGGSSIADSDIDYGSYEKQLNESINRQAVDETRKLFAENNIEKFSVRDLAEKNENTGQMVFRNPDDPNRPFSSRQEAQSWCDSMNKDIDEEFKRRAMAKRAELLEQYQPAMEMIRFANDFKKFDKVKQEVLDDLIAPYAIVNNGQIVGYRCDLSKAAAQADKIIARFNKQPQAPAPQAPQAKKPGSGPAVDISGSGSGSDEGNAEPKDLSEALKMYNQQKRKK